MQVILRRVSLAAAALSVVLAVGCARIERPSTDGMAKTVQETEPEATAALKRMGEFMKKAQAFRVHAEATHDQVLRSGRKIQVGAAVDVAVRRPNRLHAVRNGDKRSLQMWYDGKTMTILDPGKNVYTTFDVPDTIDAALDHAVEEYGLVAPAADLVFSDPYEVLTENITSGFHAGMSRVNGVACHHLAFEQDAIDWQIWIEDGKQPVPRKLVITYKEEPGEPQYTAVFSKWEFLAQIPDDVFVFKKPKDAEQIEILKVRESAAAGTKEGK
jgi:hypothetical protein